MSEENLLTILYPTPCYIKSDYFKDTYVPSKGSEFIYFALQPRPLGRGCNATIG